MENQDHGRVEGEMRDVTEAEPVRGDSGAAGTPGKRVSATQSTAPGVTPSPAATAPGRFASILTWGLVLLVLGSLITYMGLGTSDVDDWGRVELSGWVVLGALIQFTGLALAGMGIYELLKNLEHHFRLARGGDQATT